MIEINNKEYKISEAASMLNVHRLTLDRLLKESDIVPIYTLERGRPCLKLSAEMIKELKKLRVIYREKALQKQKNQKGKQENISAKIERINPHKIVESYQQSKHFNFLSKAFM